MKSLKYLIRCTDLFYSTEILRYNNLPQYKTLTGGIISIIILVSIFIGFSRMILNTVRKTTTTSTMHVQKNLIPTAVDLITGKQKFMLAVSVSDYLTTQAIDLVEGPQIFEIFSYVKGTENKQILLQKLELQPCTLQSWQNQPIVVSNFAKLQMQRWMCLKLQQKVSLKGSFLADSFSYLQFSAKKCRNSTSSNKFASAQQIQSVFDKFSDFSLNFAFLQPILNPNIPKHIQYSLNLQNYVFFSNQHATFSEIKMKDFTFITDNSILPFQDLTTEKGVMTQGDIINNVISKPKQNGKYACVVFIKSRNSMVYRRQFLKVSAVISFIGSLVGAVVLLLFIVKTYTNHALQINIALDLFKDQGNIVTNQKQKGRKIRFNLLNFICIYLYRMLRNLKIGEKFTISKKMVQYREEINQQLDIKVLLRRIIKLQQSLGRILMMQEIKDIREKVISYEMARKDRYLFTYDQKSQGTDSSSTEKNNPSLRSSNQINNQAVQEDQLASNNRILESVDAFEDIDKDQNKPKENDIDQDHNRPKENQLHIV